MKRLFVSFMIIDVLIFLYMVIYGYYIYSFVFILAAVLLLFIFGKLSSGGYIENILLAYLQKHGRATRQDVVEYLNRETKNKANVDLEGIVEEILFRLVEKKKIEIRGNEIFIRLPKEIR